MCECMDKGRARLECMLCEKGNFVLFYSFVNEIYPFYKTNLEVLQRNKTNHPTRAQPIREGRRTASLKTTSKEPYGQMVSDCDCY